LLEGSKIAPHSFSLLAERRILSFEFLGDHYICIVSRRRLAL